MTATFIQYSFARFTPKLLKPLLYKFLYSRERNRFTLEDSSLKDKRVLLVGPADTLSKDLQTIRASEYDVIVKMNNGFYIQLPDFKGHEDRCDILFHSLSDDTFPLPPGKLKSAGVKTLVHRTPKRSSFLSTLAASWKLRDVVEVKILPYEHYEKIREELDFFSPTTGLICIDFLLASPAKEVAIAGFTFYTTGYAEGYTEKTSTIETQWDRVQREAHHSPSREARFVRDSIKAASLAGKTIKLGPDVMKSLQEATSRI
nr:hypothetical protein [uncultured Celeribacter sp.]